MAYILNMFKRNSLLIALVLVMIFFEVLIQSTDKGSLFSPQNFTNIIYQNSYVIILAVGMLFLIIGCGNIDLSVGSIVALIGAVAGVLMVNNEYNIYMSMAICILPEFLIMLKIKLNDNYEALTCDYLFSETGRRVRAFEA
ncbi:MAG: hypothetical protein SPK70_06750, partial [Succinivibrio dextrinosolvens]|nr:hypothetical protein [Succinivibrio dextrinosolvens]